MGRRKKFKKNSKRSILIIILLLILIGVGIWWYFNIYNKPQTVDTPTVKNGVVYLAEEGTVQSELKVTFFELYGSSGPQVGDSLLIECGDVDILIDAGEKASGSKTVVPFLQEHVEDKVLEMVVVTHADSDHLGGMVGLSDGYGALEIPEFSYEYIIDFGYETTTKVYSDYVALRNNCVEKGTKYVSVERLFETDNTDIDVATRFYLGADTFLDFLDYKTYAMDDITDDNNRSVSCLLSHGENTFLFTGDAETKEENYLCELELPEIDVFKANHHGSPTSNTEKLLNEIKPQYVIISSSEENKYNLPKKKIVNRLCNYTDHIYATFISGNIEVISKNNQITIESTRELIQVQNSLWYKTDDPDNPR